MDRFALLRELLGQEPSPEAWDTIVKLFEDWPEDGEHTLAKSYAREHLSHWLSELRLVQAPEMTDHPIWELATTIHYTPDGQEPHSFVDLQLPKDWCHLLLQFDQTDEMPQPRVPQAFKNESKRRISVFFPRTSPSATLTELYETVFRYLLQQRQMRALYLKSSMTQLPESFYQLKSLQHLVIEDQELLSLSSDISRFKNLRGLFLSTSHLVGLPKTLGSLKKLRHLSVKTHSLEHFPTSLASLEQLVSFSLCLNYLEFYHWDPNKCHSVPPRLQQSLTDLFVLLGQLPSLQKLELSGSFHEAQLKSNTIPPEINLLQSLRELDVSYFVKLLPDTIVELPNLERIWFYDFSTGLEKQLHVLFPEGRLVSEHYSKKCFQINR